MHGPADRPADGPAADRAADRRARPRPKRLLLALPGVRRLARQRDRLAADLARVLADRQRLSEERDLLFEQRNDLSDNLHRVAEARDTVIGQRDGLQQEVFDLTGERDGLRIHNGHLIAERDGLQAEVRRLNEQLQPRAYLAHEYLRGQGIEIGPLHRPTPVPPGTVVRFVDRLPVATLKEHYPHLAELDLVEPHVIDDGEKLEQIASASVDFIIANHFLEHCEDPIGTLLTFLDRLRPGGSVFLAIPDKRHTFDHDRPVTTVEHLRRDHVEGPAWSRRDHFLEYVSLVERHEGDAAVARADELEAQGYSIHFHVWTSTEVYALVDLVREGYAPELELIGSLTWNDEVVVVLRKQAPDQPPAA